MPNVRNGAITIKASPARVLVTGEPKIGRLITIWHVVGVNMLLGLDTKGAPSSEWFLAMTSAGGTQNLRYQSSLARYLSVDYDTQDNRPRDMVIRSTSLRPHKQPSHISHLEDDPYWRDRGTRHESRLIFLTCLHCSCMNL